MRIAPPPGLFLDNPPVSAGPFWTFGVNVRFRLDMAETIGLFGPVLDPTDAQIVLPASSDPYRAAFTTPSTATGQVLFGAANALALMDFDPASTPATRTRWRAIDLTPAGLSAATDVVPVPSVGRIEVPPVWWFADQDDVVVMGRANVSGDQVYAWDRSRTNLPVALSNSPTGAVGGGIINRILVLVGCTSFTDPDPKRFMTIRWSDRFNFNEWTPSDVNVSGELQLEGGSRIVGGGVTGFGVVAWTDKRFALLTETFDPLSVFERRYIDGGRGLLANNAWCETDGRVWWFDESRVLNVFDGGRPRQIPNPLKYATIERLSDSQTARAYLVPNPEYGEIILHYPDQESVEPDTQLVYNYILDCWSIWRLPRTGWSPRVGVIRNLGVDASGAVWQHDLDPSLPDEYIIGPGLPAAVQGQFPSISGAPPADEVSSFNFTLITNLVTTENVTEQVWRATRIHADHLPSPADGAETDQFSVVLNGYGEAQPAGGVVIDQDRRDYPQGDNAKDFRVGGKALQIALYGVDIKTVFRFSGFNVTSGTGGDR